MNVRIILRKLKKQGWTWSFTGKSHLRAVSPKGDIVITGGTPSDQRAIHNFIAKLRQKGADL